MACVLLTYVGLDLFGDIKTSCWGDLDGKIMYSLPPEGKDSL